MTKGKMNKFVVLIAKASTTDEWLFVIDKKSRCWGLPIFKLWPWNDHPIRKAVDESIKMLGDLTNIELSFELSGGECTVIVFTIHLESIINTYPNSDRQSWMTPAKFMVLPESSKDDLSFDVIKTIEKSLEVMGKKSTGTKSNPRTMKVD